MAERSGPSRILPCILVGLGAFLLAIAILIPTYTVGKLEKTPLDLEVTTVATGTGSVLNSAALLGGKAQVDTNVPIEETVDSFEQLVNGDLDDLPEQAFFNVGNADSARAKAAGAQDRPN